MGLHSQKGSMGTLRQKYLALLADLIKERKEYSKDIN